LLSFLEMPCCVSTPVRYHSSGQGSVQYNLLLYTSGLCCSTFLLHLVAPPPIAVLEVCPQANQQDTIFTTKTTSRALLQEIKLGEKQRIEALFERAVHLQLSPKKMKFLFKRYLQYEQEHGDATAVANVKKQALDFVQQHM